MNIVITGSNGFVGKNLKEDMRSMTNYVIYEINRQTSTREMEQALLESDFVVHLAGVNRPKDDAKFKEGNVDFFSQVLEILKRNSKKPTVLFSSSIQAEKNNPYGESKREGEAMLRQFSKENGNDVYIYRLLNLFGKWCKPNYNSVIATFCHKIAHDEEIQVNDRNVILSLNYIDDVIKEFKNAIEGQPNLENGTPTVPNAFKVSLGEIVDLLYKFKKTREDRKLPKLDDLFEKDLYSTYLSYLPKDAFSYPLITHEDHRGSFTEFIKSPDRGQVSVNVSKPGVLKGEHWHHTKNEKFLVVSGKGVIRFRKIGEDEVIEYHVSEDKLEVVDIPVGYTHNIENLGVTDMVTIMWVNEMFDPNNADTYFEEV
ncbi:capsular polysaccharide biosynthesis protein CapF [Staphylococcus durrellii]|uniref:capsular polysaccharide biosynthesis protein CapF n=1 Tax=Staphylococcus durrellii TaxID=2781773 RepID=UPI00189D59B3|nr:capsular polysaccharide biosynthesis protein CapF [Staphylococcus durrellii]MBF7018001.1 capsular polysaccharide biosynthesis protein CapF [Staphylococcus durrellii]